MLTLHLASEGGYYGVLRPWVEADAEERERARSLRRNPPKPTVDAPECPFNGGPELLHAALPPGFEGGPDQWAVVWLPSDDQGPIPSSQRIGARSSRKARRLAPWAISTRSLEPRDMATLMAGYARLKPVWPEGWLGEDFAFWRAVWEVAGAMVVRQQYLPGLRRMGEDSSQWSPAWEPMYDAEDLRRQEELAAAMPVVARAVRWKAEQMPPNEPKLLVSDMVSRLVDCLVWMAHLTHDVSRRHAPRRSRWTWRSKPVDERWVETLLINS